ncbi:hypothetical protein [Clostridium sp.]|uniref:hypothetical protein n=1 Tax=Clostridium sp. TaxID=1506 RepID=UPI0026097A0F|nr:hypothetical protein [Clostridium sp.]
MKKIKKIKDLYKIIIIYFISTIISGFVEHLTIEYDYIPNPDFIYSLIAFTLTFLVLTKIFKVHFKSILIFLRVIMFLLIFVLLNLSLFIDFTPKEGVFPLMTVISLITTLPFQYIIHTLIGYKMLKASYIGVPIYMLGLTILCYVTIEFKKKKKIN